MSKNIHDLSDDEFDDLFRESAEKSDIGFDPDAWNKMSKKLDAASTPPSSPGKGGNPLTKWGLPAIVVLLLLITGTYFFLRKPSGAVTETKVKEKENSLKQTDKAEEKDVATDKVDTENKENTKEANIANDKVETDKVTSTEIKEKEEQSNKSVKTADELPNTTENVVSAKVTLDKQATKWGLATTVNKQKGRSLTKTEQKVNNAQSGKKVADNNTAKAYQTIEKSSDRLAVTGDTNVIFNAKTATKAQSLTVTNEKEATAISKNNPKNPALRDSKITNNQALSSKTESRSSVNNVEENLKTTLPRSSFAKDSASTIEKMQWVPVNTLSFTEYLFTINLKLPNVYFESPALAPVSIPKANTEFKRGLNIRLALSPDFSFIPSNKIFKVGNNWAAILEYRFNNRLSIQSGVIRSMKYYGALPSQYEWNSYWTMPSPLKDIDATCKMLDIPLNLRYDIWQKYRSRWFVGGGFTSYIMLKEEYRYNYENPADPNIKRTSWEGKTGAYPFSVLNLSAGYERQLFRRLTIQAEPFYKAPLGKVGYGKVRLATAGVFFSVKYPF